MVLSINGLDEETNDDNLGHVVVTQQNSWLDAFICSTHMAGTTTTRVLHNKRVVQSKT